MPNTAMIIEHPAAVRAEGGCLGEAGGRRHPLDIAKWLARPVPDRAVNSIEVTFQSSRGRMPQ
jgi:hypothetical protein